MSLFQLGDFTLRFGKRSAWKIECDSLTPDDWAALAAMAVEILPPFGFVEGVPRGGLPFAEALRKYITPGSMTLLIAEDVCTSGGSLERHRDGRALAIGIAVFCRGTLPPWVKALFAMAGS